MVESAHKRKEAGIPQTSFPIFPDSFGKEGIANVHYSFVVFNIEKQKFSYHILPFFPSFLGGLPLEISFLETPMFLKKNTLLRAREGSRELAVGDFTDLKLYWRHGT